MPQSAESSLIIQNLHFDSLRSRVTRRLEGLDPILQRESMRNQRFQINDSSSDETNRLGVDIVISILPAEINLFGGEMHEGDGLEILADTDHEDGAAETGGLFVRYIRLLFA